jgi:CTP synthase
VSNRIIEWIKEAALIPVCNGTENSPRVADVCLVEVGGTVGDIESMVFLEALRQLQFTEGKANVIFIHISLVPCVGGGEQQPNDESTGEYGGDQKTKPTQHSAKALTSLGIFPEIVCCRSGFPLTQSTKQKLSIFCQVSPANIISVHNISNIYHVPKMLVEQNLHGLLYRSLFANSSGSASPTDLAPNLTTLEQMAHKLDQLENALTVVIVGKYTGVSDTYLSVLKSITHSGVALNVDVKVTWVNSVDLETDTKDLNPAAYAKAWQTLTDTGTAGIIIPGGFGVRGIEGKILAAKYARTKSIPCLGLCLGMQVMCIEFARNVMGLEGANSIEFDSSTSQPVIIYMPETDVNIGTDNENGMGNKKDMGGTMRLGSRATYLSKFLHNGQPSIAWEFYGCDKTSPNAERTVVYERYRHRYEVNPSWIRQFESSGMFFSGRGFAEGDDALHVELNGASETTTDCVTDDAQHVHRLIRMEVAELPRSVHPYYVGGQFHPEYKSRPNRPAPLFYGFVKASLNYQQHHHGAQASGDSGVLNASSPTKRLRGDYDSKLSIDADEGAGTPLKQSRSMSSKSEAVSGKGVCSPLPSWRRTAGSLSTKSTSDTLPATAVLQTSASALEMDEE